MPKLDLRKIPSTNLLRHLRYAAYKWFPNWFFHPDLTQDIDYWRERDPKINAQTKPPKDEFIDLRCLWAVEFYTPVHLDNLLNGFRKLGWSEKNTLAHRRDPAGWVQRSRQHSSSGGIFNLGIVNPSSSDSFLSSHARTAPLPPNVQYATGRIYSLTSSLTCIVMGFVFKEDFSAQFDEALRTDRQTYTEPSSKGMVRICDPRTQKSDHIRQIRKDITELFMKWFSENLPGLFSSGILGGDLPTCEFVTLRQTKPFPNHNAESPDYMSLLDMDFKFAVWQSKDIQGLKLVVSGRRDHSLRHHSILAAREDDFDEEKMEIFRDQSNRKSQIYYIDNQIKGLLSRWAILPLLEGYGQHLSVIRDSVTFRSKSRQDPVEILKTIGHHVSDSVDIVAVTAELISYTRQDFLFSLDVDTFEPCNKQDYESGYTLDKDLSSTISNNAIWLQKTDQSLRDHLIGYGSLLGAKENIILQKKLSHLTIIILLLTVVLVVHTLGDGTLSKILEPLQNLPTKLWEIVTILVKKA